MITPREKIKMPKNIQTLEQYYKWKESLTTPKQDVDVEMKYRGYYPFDFSTNPNGKVDYLIFDSVSRGCCYVKNFNRVFNFYLIKY